MIEEDKTAKMTKGDTEGGAALTAQPSGSELKSNSTDMPNVVFTNLEFETACVQRLSDVMVTSVKVPETQGDLMSGRDIFLDEGVVVGKSTWTESDPERLAHEVTVKGAVTVVMERSTERRPPACNEPRNRTK